jgi:hypothetical protein
MPGSPEQDDRYNQPSLAEFDEEGRREETLLEQVVVETLPTFKQRKSGGEGTSCNARGEGSVWKRVVSEVVAIRCAFSSHSAALGIGRIFSLISSRSSNVLPMPP